MAEQDNMGIPLSYLLLSTATSITAKKRIKAIQAWLKVVRDTYKINPRFIHSDKDIAEIQAGKLVWGDAKHQLCWWHLRKAIRERMAKKKKETTLYDPAQAHARYAFIDPKWKPGTPADMNDVEGGRVDELLEPAAGFQMDERTDANKIQPIRLTLPARAEAYAPVVESDDEMDTESGSELGIERTDDERDGLWNPVAKKKKRKANKKKRRRGKKTGPAKETLVEDVFCPEIFREDIVAMVEKHLCAHPLIPGDAAPTPAGIHAWAVKKMYTYCYENELPELWAYLWGNWYCPSRWILWARSAAPEIPRLKTTMICESQ